MPRVLARPTPRARFSAEPLDSVENLSIKDYRLVSGSTLVLDYRESTKNRGGRIAALAKQKICMANLVVSPIIGNRRFTGWTSVPCAGGGTGAGFGVAVRLAHHFFVPPSMAYQGPFRCTAGALNPPVTRRRHKADLRSRAAVTCTALSFAR